MSTEDVTQIGVGKGELGLLVNVKAGPAINRPDPGYDKSWVITSAEIARQGNVVVMEIHSIACSYARVWASQPGINWTSVDMYWSEPTTEGTES